MFECQLESLDLFNKVAFVHLGPPGEEFVCCEKVESLTTERPLMLGNASSTAISFHRFSTRKHF